MNTMRDSFRNLGLIGMLAAAPSALACDRAAREAPPATVDSATADTIPDARVEWGMVVHGGAGTILRETMTPELEAEYRETLTRALRAGHAALRDGSGSVDAVEAAIRILEDSPLFNAGRGAVFTADGRNSLDAAIMDGATLRAGSIAGVSDVRNPITLARRVMDTSRHVMFSGEGAEQFAREQEIGSTPPDYFHTDSRWRQLEQARSSEREGGQPETQKPISVSRTAPPGAVSPTDELGTVGAIALDREGRLAVGTSTGGMTNKKWGRIGDSPLIGAGTYAGPACAVSGTGWGEYFIRNVVAYDICARASYAGVGVPQAAREVIALLDRQEPETGGVIAMDSEGRVAMPFNTRGMYRGYIDQDGVAVVEIYRPTPTESQATGSERR
ncbi:MAG: isoaspartyl peptidase/L-asparaginase family protein [Longimicrobiales bacterium]